MMSDDAGLVTELLWLIGGKTAWRRRFTVATLSRLVRLSYWARIQSVLPPTFHGLLPPKPEVQVHNPISVSRNALRVSCSIACCCPTFHCLFFFH